MTNFEKIKQDINAMTAEEFEEAYGDMTTTCREAYGQKCPYAESVVKPPCFECSVKWLNEEVDDGRKL